jgi:hypothetical protein
LRRRIHDGIDRRFYRQKYDAEQTLAAFSASLREQVELEQLSSQLIVVVEQAMQPLSVNIWMKDLNAETQRREELKE